ncbi:MAG TPA: M20/M25/M40 family metallo-hydrolase [Vicinamibacteria bacterium]|nr:M20/M25/M40 family metallo-hydrolase [Vicinamibacteria bacterium]
MENGLRFEAAALLRDLEALVVRESPSDDAERVTALARFVARRLEERGVRAETRPCPPRGEALLARVGEGGALLLGHLDTVWPAGSLAELAFAVRDGRASGPGVFDMKAGIAVAMAVVPALAQAPKLPGVTLLLTPDEEVGSAASRALLLDEAGRHDRVFVLEPPQQGAAKVARKGTGLFELRFAGRAAHAGLEPEKGRSALIALARAALFCTGLGDAARGTSVTPTVARAGAKTNVVPEAASLQVDVRVWSQAEARRVEAALRGYASEVDGVVVAVEGEFDRPPMEESPGSRRLYEAARRIAAELGFELGAARVGGGSDGNLTAAAGVPTLDGLGPDGGGAHARDECVFVDDLARRAELLARLVLETA